MTVINIRKSSYVVKNDKTERAYQILKKYMRVENG